MSMAKFPAGTRGAQLECLEKEIIEWQVLKSSVKKSVEQLLYDKTKRRPSVFPIIMEI